MRQSRLTVLSATSVGEVTEAGRETFQPLESLLGIYRSNQRLLGLLERTRRDLDRARGYLAEPDSNLALGIARVGQLRERRRKVLRQLEANWMVVRELDAIPQAG
jgi:hypothetical protein